MVRSSRLDQGVRAAFAVLMAFVLICGCSMPAFALESEDATPAVEDATAETQQEPATSEPASEADDEGAALQDDQDAEAPADDATDGEAEGDLATAIDGIADAFGSVSSTFEETPETVEAPVADGVYTLQSAALSGTVLGIVDGSSAAGAAVHSWTANGMPDQRFELASRQDGFYTVTNVHSGLVLAVAAPDGSQASVTQQVPDGSYEQSWQVVAQSNGTYALVNRAYAHLALDAGTAQPGDVACASFVSSSATQSFYLVATSSDASLVPDALAAGTYLVASAANPDLVLATPDYSMASGQALQLSAATTALSQIVVVEVDASGCASLRLANSGLAIRASQAIVGAAVVQGAADGSAAARWIPKAAADGSYQLLSAASGLALSVVAGVDGTGATLAAATGSITQRWVLKPVETVLADGIYSFYSLLDNNMAMDTADASAVAGARAQLCERTSMPAQKYAVASATVTSGASGEGSDAGEAASVSGVTVQSLTGGMFLAEHADGSVTFDDETGALDQLWVPRANAAGGVTLVNAGSGHALAVSGGMAGNGTPLVATDAATGTPAQAFRAIAVNPVDNGTYVIQLAASGRALDVADASRADGANVQVVTANGGGAQAWNIEATGTGWYTIVNARSKKALDVEGGQSVPGTNVHQWTENGGGAQLWRIEFVDGAYRFVSACGGLVLEAAGAGTWDGANVYVGTASAGSDAQRFRVVPTVYVQEDFEDLLASFTTYSTNTANGTYNMQRALQSFNGVVVQPGETLSFFAVAGPCGAAQGYLPAGVVGGVGYGGGICQASTTLYGATLRAGMTIVDRQNHSVPSTYVPIGLDAMVNYGTSDYQFRNDLADPIKIVVYTYDNVLTCEVWGIQPDWYDYIEPDSWYTGPNSAAASRTWYKDGVAVHTEALPSSWYW